MTQDTTGRRAPARIGTLGGIVAGLVLGMAAVAGYFLNEPQARATAVQASGPASTATGGGATKPTGESQTAALPPLKGPSGLPLPRFVSLKASKVNVRRGPSREYGIAWVYRARGLPVEVVSEFGNWRRIRDAEGAEGWVLRTLLSGWRTAMVAPWHENGLYPLRDSPGGRVIAQVKSGVIGRLLECDGQWCRLRINRFEGWMEQNTLWGVYPGERFAAR
jgi:SH3-like domain-containing protein